MSWRCCLPRELTIGSRPISDDTAPFVIAEIGHNHGGSEQTARKMIRAAAGCGVSAVKLQKRDTETLYSPAMLAQPYEHEHSFGRTYGEHRAALEFGRTEYLACRAQAQACRVEFFATAFDEPSADFLMEIGVPAIKLASGSLTDLALLTYVSRLGVPVILSTGSGDAHDIDRAMQTMTRHTYRVALLHCTAAYPVLNYEELNLRCIQTLRERYPETVIGWSGHVSGIAMALVAYALGARILEQHFTLNRASKGTDHAFSLEPGGMKKLVRDLDRARVAMGDGVKRLYLSELAPISKMRRWLINGKWQVGTPAEQTPKVWA